MIKLNRRSVKSFSVVLKRNNLREAVNRKFVGTARDELNHALFVAFVVEDVEDCGGLVVQGLFLIGFLGVVGVVKKPF